MLSRLTSYAVEAHILCFLRPQPTLLSPSPRAYFAPILCFVWRYIMPSTYFLNTKPPKHPLTTAWFPNTIRFKPIYLRLGYKVPEGKKEAAREPLLAKVLDKRQCQGQMSFDSAGARCARTAGYWAVTALQSFCTASIAVLHHSGGIGMKKVKRLKG